jgi:hypothetical protein
MFAMIRRTVHGPSARRAQARRRPLVEALEGRQLLSDFAAPFAIPSLGVNVQILLPIEE